MQYKDIQQWNDNGLLAKNEYKFLRQVYNQNRLTDKQIQWRDAIGVRVLKGTVVRDVFEDARQQSVSVF